jgi:hypothetical protein
MGERETYRATQQARCQLVEHPETAGRQLRHGEHPTKKKPEPDE